MIDPMALFGGTSPTTATTAGPAGEGAEGTGFGSVLSGLLDGGAPGGYPDGLPDGFVEEAALATLLGAPPPIVDGGTGVGAVLAGVLEARAELAALVAADDQLAVELDLARAAAAVDGLLEDTIDLTDALAAAVAADLEELGTDPQLTEELLDELGASTGELAPVDGAPVDGAPVEGAPVPVEGAPVPVDGAPVEGEGAPVEGEGAPVPVEGDDEPASADGPRGQQVRDAVHAALRARDGQGPDGPRPEPAARSEAPPQEEPGRGQPRAERELPVDVAARLARADLAGRAQRPGGRVDAEGPRAAEAVTVTGADLAAEPLRGAERPSGRPEALPPALQRVLDAVRALENQPPPRHLVLDLGEVRIRIGLQDNGVRLTVLDGQQAAGEELLADARELLADRGFDLAGDGGDDRSGDDPDDPAGSVPTPPATDPVRTAGSRARGLRL